MAENMIYNHPCSGSLDHGNLVVSLSIENALLAVSPVLVLTSLTSFTNIVARFL